MIISDHLVLALARDRQRDLREEAAAVRVARLAPRRIRFGRVRIGVESTEEVVAATKRLAAEGLATEVEDGTTCCYALQDKVWVTGPGGEPWEVYTVLADAGAELEGKTQLDVAGVSAAASGGGC